MTPMKTRMRFASYPLACLAVLAIAEQAEAVSYASQVRNTSGTTWEYVINQDASNVTITRDGGNALSLGALSAGRYTFDLETFSSFDIQVETTQADGLARVSDINNLFTEFNRPSGLAINKDPGSEFFGTIYVANSIASASAGQNGRVTGDGIYALRPDLQGVDFSNPTWPVPSANDSSQAKIGTGWSVVSDGANAVFRIALDDGGNVIAGDWSNVNGGIKYIGADLTGGGLVLAGQNGQGYGQINSSGTDFIHSAVRGVPNVTGTVGVDLVVSAVDAGLTRNPGGLFDGTYPDTGLPDTDTAGFPVDSNHVWRWDVGSETDSEAIPTQLIDTGNQGANPFELGNDVSGRPYVIPNERDLRVDAEYFPQIGDDGLWIYTSPRFDGNESGIIIIEVDETGSTAPQVLWSSREWTIANDLDGYVGTDAGIPEPNASDPNNDVFRNTGSVEVSNDGSTLYVHRWVTDDPDFVDPQVGSNPDVNPYVGQDSPLPGAILAIPLDGNGIPDIAIDDNGTPLDTSDDILTNLESISTTDQDGEFDLGLEFSAGGTQENHEIEVDAAGNIYITDSFSDLVEVFTPGGDRTTTFSFDGVSFTFDDGLTAAPPFLLGDADGDGDVDGDDLIAVQTEFGATGMTPLFGDADGDGDVDGDDLIAVQTQFGSTSPAIAVPEPSALLLALSAGCGLLCRRR